MWSDFLIVFAAALMIAAASAFLTRRKTFSMNTFLISFAIAIAILVWIPLLETYMIGLSVLLIISVMMGDYVREKI